MQMTIGFTTQLLTDIEDEPLTRPLPDRGNHPYWLLGHIVVSEAALLDQYLLGRPNRFESWLPTFAIGSTPGNTVNGGPSFKELLSALDDVRTASLRHIDSLDDEDLQKPCCTPEGAGPPLKTVADCLNSMSIHMAFHAGQVADARRAAGRTPLLF